MGLCIRERRGIIISFARAISQSSPTLTPVVQQSMNHQTQRSPCHRLVRSVCQSMPIPFQPLSQRRQTECQPHVQSFHFSSANDSCHTDDQRDRKKVFFVKVNPVLDSMTYPPFLQVVTFSPSHTFSATRRYTHPVPAVSVRLSVSIISNPLARKFT